MNAIDENEFVKGWRDIEKTIPKPQAILCISAHWETRGTYVTSSEHPSTLYDFGGFPPTLYAQHYPAPGNLKLAGEIQRLIHSASVTFDDNRGLDHGCWSVLIRMYPNADIPVIQMSMDYEQTPQFHYDLAKELAPLRRQGVLILCSGNMVHNLQMLAWDKMDEASYGYDWAIEASEKMKEFIIKDDHRSLIHYEQQGKAFNRAIPTNEHFLPLLYALALKEDQEKITIFNDKAIAGSLTMTSLKLASD
jgi:4,5-DOPA dioxygenase extradiol